MTNMIGIQVAMVCLALTTVVCDLPPGTRRNTYLPPDPTKGYNYDKPSVPFPSGPRPTPTYPVGPSRPTPTFPVGPTRPNIPSIPSGPRPTPYPGGPAPYPGPGPRPIPSFPSGPRPTPSFPSGPRPTPGYPEYTGQPSGTNGNTIPGSHDHHDHHHEPGMPFDFNYAVKEDAYGNDYSHNAISDGDVVRGEYRVQLPDGRLQIVRYTADWKNGFNAQVSYEGTPRYDVPRPQGGSFNRGY